MRTLSLLRRLAAAALICTALLASSGCAGPRRPCLPWKHGSAVSSSQNTARRKRASKASGAMVLKAMEGHAIPSSACAETASSLAEEAEAYSPSAAAISAQSSDPSAPARLLGLSLRWTASRAIANVAMSCPAQSPRMAFALGKISSPSLPATANLMSVAQNSTPKAAGLLADGFDHEAFVRRYLRLSSADPAQGGHEPQGQGAATGSTESQIARLSDIFAHPLVRAGKADPRGKIYATDQLGPDALTADRTDPASGLEASGEAILKMAEARAAAESLSGLMASKAPQATKRDGLDLAASLVSQAYANGYPRGFPRLG